MSITTTPAAPGFQPASLPSTADELLGRLLLLKPGEVRQFETRHGLSDATMSEIVEVEPNGSPIRLGERAIFWQYVRRQLAHATPELPWIGGRLVQNGQAYRLDPPDEHDGWALRTAMEELATE